jgi:phage-related protein
MKEVTTLGLRMSRRIGRDLYEIRAYAPGAHYRLIFSQETKFVLLALHVFDKDTQKLPLPIRRLAEDRLKDWRSRGSAL